MAFMTFMFSGNRKENDGAGPYPEGRDRGFNPPEIFVWLVKNEYKQIFDAF